MSTSRLIVGPFNRVEGDLEVHLDIADGVIQSARVCAPLYRGFESMLLGRDPMDAMVYVPRICGICSVSQSVAAARAIAGLAGLNVPPNGLRATNLMLATENAADHLTHFYLFFMPDFTRPCYATRPWHAEAVRRFGATTGAHSRDAVAARARWFEILGLLGGKWPHTESVHPAGSTRGIDTSEQLRLLARIHEFRSFLERVVVGDHLEALAALETADDLARWRARSPGTGDLRFFLDIADDLALHTRGIGPGRTLSVGAYPDTDGNFAFPPGVLRAGAAQAVDLSAITEDVSHAWYHLTDQQAVGSPASTQSAPNADQAQGYTWAKAPRYDGHTMETGALARQLASGQALIDSFVARSDARSNVLTRVLARIVELARIVPLAESWVRAIEPGAPFAAPSRAIPTEGTAVGLTEAARGSLAHWVGVENGRLSHYQIVAPTTWNFSPRDIHGTPGPLESALVGTPVEPGERTPVLVQHIVRSFDPCMVCTVH